MLESLSKKTALKNCGRCVISHKMESARQYIIQSVKTRTWSVSGMRRIAVFRLCFIDGRDIVKSWNARMLLTLKLKTLYIRDSGAKVPVLTRVACKHICRTVESRSNLLVWFHFEYECARW